MARLWGVHRNCGQGEVYQITCSPTPGLCVPLSDGQVLDIEDVDAMDTEAKEDALVKMQAMMDNMQLLMEKLQKKQ